MNLSSFITKYGIRTTSNFQLRDIFTDLNINGQMLMRDELKTTKKQFKKTKALLLIFKL